MSRAPVVTDAEKGCNPGDDPLTLRTLRELRNLQEPGKYSIRAVEAATGISRATLSRIERGIEVPTPVHLLALSDHYGVHPAGWRVTLEYRIDSRAIAA